MLMTLTQALDSLTARRARNVAYLSGERPTSHTLDTIAVIEGQATACRTLLAFPTEQRRDHAVRLLCEGALMQPATGNAHMIRVAEMEIYADAVSGRLNLV